MSDNYGFLNYRILFTPLVTDGVYGTTVDVTQDIDLTDFIKSFSTMKREVDNGDYDIGIFTFGSITLNTINYSRKFNDEDEALSIFPFTRDKCKVEIEFRDRSNTAYTRFVGLINEEGTRIDLKRNITKFKVLSMDSIFKQVKVPAGAIVTGDLFSTAIKKILNVPEITNILTYSAGNVNVDLDLAIDDGEYFSSTVVKNSLDELLIASNSILYIDNATQTIHVKARQESATVFELYGHGDKFGRSNILDIKEYNNGLHRAYTSVKINDNTVVENDAYIGEIGYRQKDFSFDFITTSSKEESIGNNVLLAFQTPKKELTVNVRTEDVNNIELLDVVRVDYDYITVPDPRDSRLPLVGIDAIGSFHLPYTRGSVRIRPEIKWKVIGIQENPKKLTTLLKLRQVGTMKHDGYFGVDAPIEWSDNTQVTWGDGSPATWSNS